MSAEQAVVEKSPCGVTDCAMTGAWRVIVARTPQRYVAYYYHANDNPRIKQALTAQAYRWYAAQCLKEE